ncbi:MAG: alpha-L-rhamnosidase N-terminal domain-containing protein, partial [Armatimonadetes bacterium]|nr:alpha-L-rhamnosidase N-terminal domain-containing protein [Armatimonadota bacterium]
MDVGLLATLLALNCLSGAAAPPSAVDLRAEYLTDALGLDTAWPRLSWRLDDPAATRAQQQTAYRVTVASRRELLLAGSADLWDSGRVAGPQSVGVEYAGRPLRSGQMAWWRVQVWDRDGRALPPSAPARFSVGLLSQADWQARWIGMASAAEGECPWLRREFDLERVPGVALASVGTLGFHELYVNGRRVGDAVLTPSVSDLRRRALYVTYDLTPYLKPGRNAVGLWIAPGWTQFLDGNPDKVNFGVAKAPLVIAQLQLDGRTLGTDDSWRCALSSTRHLGRWQNGDFGGDRVDAGRELPGWCAAGLDDSGWEKATVYETGRALTPDVIEPNQLSAPIAARSMSEVAPGKWRFVMDRLYAGWVQVELRGKPGEQVTIKASSLADREVEFNALNQYILGPSGHGTFRNRFSYHEIGFVTVEGLSQPPALGDVVGYQVTNSRRRVGGFDCSD